MSWHYNPTTGIWSKWADNAQDAAEEIQRINTDIYQGKSVGGASPEWGQSLISLALIPVAAHAAAGAVLGRAAATTAAGTTVAAGGAAAGGAGLAAGGAALGAAGLAGKALDLGKDLTLTGALAMATQWLTKYWWIPTIFIGLWTVGKFGGK